jgi:hypothetical protein
MDPLTGEPTTFKELVEADLRRAARLIIKVQDEIDWQLRFATPEGDFHIAVTMDGNERERHEVLLHLGVFMEWKRAAAFVLATETVDDQVYAVGIAPHEAHRCRAAIRREPRPWTASSFGTIEWLPRDAIDPELEALLPTEPRPLTPKEVAAMTHWFGRDGRFPAVNMKTGQLGA